MGISVWRARGLTLGEVMVSITLLSLMLVTTIVLFTQLLASTTKNGYLESASVLADRVLEQATLNPSSSPPAYPPLTTGSEQLLVEGEERSTEFLYRLEATPVADPAGTGERWFLEVEVRWWTDDIEGKSAGRQGYGELKTTQSRLVYVKW